jgi:hypothetical protein
MSGLLYQNYLQMYCYLVHRNISFYKLTFKSSFNETHSNLFHETRTVQVDTFNEKNIPQVPPPQKTNNKKTNNKININNEITKQKQQQQQKQTKK